MKEPQERASGQTTAPQKSLYLQAGSVKPFLLTAPGSSMPCSECDFLTGMWVGGLSIAEYEGWQR